MRKLTFATLLIAAGSAAPTWAASPIDQIQALSQPQFRMLVEDLGGALSYKPLIPSTTLGITGFDLGIEMTATKLDNPAVLDRASSGNGASTLISPKIAFHKGLPLGMDVGAFYMSVPSSNIKLFGGEFRYAIVDGGLVTPTVSVRASYTKLTGVDQLDLDTKGLDVSVAKGFAIVTPYAGIGKVWTTGSPNGLLALAFREEKPDLTKFFGGVNFNLGLMNFAFEADKTGDTTSYGAKLGFRW